MTGPDDVSRETSTPWQQYQDREHWARNMYLLVVQGAHRQYLTGPYPDRSAYETVERDAWITYYAVCRDAWKTYATALETTPPPPPAPEPQSHPYPPAIHESISGNPWPTQRDVSPYPESDESELLVGSPFGGGTDINMVRANLEARYGPNCRECGIPWRQPSPACPHREYDVHPAGAGTQTGKADHPSASLGFPGSAFPMFTPRPESES